MVLVDTSIWIDHLRSGNSVLTDLLYECEAAIHPFIIGELSCGNLKNRKEIISLLHALPQVIKASDDEVLFFIEKHKLMGKGLGLVDCHLLASCRLNNTTILTLDKKMKTVSSQLHLSAMP